MSSCFRLALFTKRAENDVLALWNGARNRLRYEEHVETLYHIGKLVDGRNKGRVGRVEIERADKKQHALRKNPVFCALVDQIAPAASSGSADVPEDKTLAMALVALNNTHEDMTITQSKMAKPQLDWFLGIIYRLMGACYHSLHKSQMSTRCMANALHALSGLHVYEPKFFSCASKYLAHQLLGDSRNPSAHALMHLQQWLHAIVNVNHRLDADSYARLISIPWPIYEDATQRLFQLCLNVCCVGDGKNGDPLLGQLIDEINRRAVAKTTVQVVYEKMSGSLLHVAQHSRILIHNEKLSTQRFAPAVENLLDAQIAEPGRDISKKSRFEDMVARVLRRLKVRILRRDARISPFGLSADFLCQDQHGTQFYCEIDGPSHFLVVPNGDPRGRLILKKRLFRSLNLPLLSVPYWMNLRWNLSDAVARVAARERGM